MKDPGRRLWKTAEHAIAEILIKDWDPIGVQDVPECQDEYDSYVSEVVALLTRGAPDDEVAHALYRIETEAMGLGSDRIEALQRVAKRLREAYAKLPSSLRSSSTTDPVTPVENVPFGLDDLLGAYVLVGITDEIEGSSEQNLRQIHGLVVSVQSSGITLEQLKGERAGESYSLPPDLRAVRRAPPGDYRLRESGEVVTNPDYLATWVRVLPNAEQKEN